MTRVWDLLSRSLFGARQDQADAAPLDLSPLEWLEPWTVIVDPKRARLFEAELRRELARSHPLHRRRARAVAHRVDRDDVLFTVGGELAVVHLTFSGAVEQPPAPRARVFDTAPEFVAHCMLPDHDEYSC